MKFRKLKSTMAINTCLALVSSKLASSTLGQGIMASFSAEGNDVKTVASLPSDLVLQGMPCLTYCTHVDLSPPLRNNDLALVPATHHQVEAAVPAFPIHCAPASTGLLARSTLFMGVMARGMWRHVTA